MFPQIPRQGMMGPGMSPPRMGAGFGGRPSMFGMNQAPMMGMGGPQQMNRGGGLLSRLLGGRNPGGMGMGNQAQGMGGLMGMGNQARGMGGLMGMGNQARGMGGLMGGLQQAGRAAGAGGSGGVMNFLNNTQQVLRTAQSIGPMIQQVQQYGSLVKNIPAMWRLYRGFKSISNNTETDDEKKSSKSVSKQSKAQSSQVQHKSSSSSESSSSKADNSKHKKRNIEGSAKSKSSKSKNQVTWNKNTSAANAKGSSSPKLYI